MACTDGVRLAAYETGDRGLPTVVAVHGYPDDHTVWDGVVAALAGRFRVVTYDVRGAGASDRPAAKAAYRIEQLVDDLAVVLDLLAPDEAVHLLAHDWGSIQTWDAVGDERFDGRLRSFTSISGPSLDQAGVWLRGSVRHPVASAKQILESFYLGVFQLPRLPELLARAGAITQVIAASSRLRRPDRAPAHVTSRLDAAHGVQLYRANLARLLRPAPRVCRVPVQVLAPTRDLHVSARLQTEAPAPYADTLHTRVVEGNHWVVAQRPHVIARCVEEFAAYADGSAPLSRRTGPVRRNGTFAGQLVVITGGARGIGRATALEFAREGADVVIADINEVAGKEAVAEVEVLGVTATFHPLDVSDAEAWTRFADAVRAEHGVPDVLVNNAGIGMAGAFLDTSAADWEKILGVNLWSVIHGSRLFGAQMVERGEGGRIVNVASAAAFAPNRVMSAYATTKAAVLMLTDCLRAELARDGIGVTAICPGFVDTDISATTRYVGVDDGTQQALRDQAVRSYRRRGYTPERLARHAVRAAAANRPIAAISIETKLLRLVHRLAPPISRFFATIDPTQLDPSTWRRTR
ncbi:SDR family oxidoreductase [Nocardioides marmoriginsengisoli]|uniref:SDR family oxidoreductase n=1 Tax=Nocardioides marmoriginsengisoli TaxID=661483 RepID=A0A3N0CQ85_9ACTN|nr:SDR family oxidoreductase [Nocardioides marmoriginsengisoli]